MGFKRTNQCRGKQKNKGKETEAQDKQVEYSSERKRKETPDGEEGKLVKNSPNKKNATSNEMQKHLQLNTQY